MSLNLMKVLGNNIHSDSQNTLSPVYKKISELL